MKRFIICCTLLVLFLPAFSQRVYFVYIQSETNQPFFVKMQESVFSSSSSGYLILSKLRDSSYQMTVGFPDNKWRDQVFNVDIKAKDHGFTLKNFGEKWGLLDLQTANVLMSAAPVDKAGNSNPGEVSAFTDILSKAANDPSLKDKPVAVKQEEKKIVAETAVVKKEEVKEKEKEAVIIQAVVKTDTVVKKETPPVVINDKPREPDTRTVLTDTAQKKELPKLVTRDLPVAEPVVALDTPAKKNDPPPVAVVKEEKKIETPPVVAIKEEKKTEALPVIEQQYKPSVVRRRAESSTTEGFGLTFVDEYADGKKDTIRIMIPNARPAAPRQQPTEEKKFLDITTDSKETTTEKPVKKEAACSEAVENDFLRLRRRMAAESGDDAMVGEAVKYFKTKCFSTAQLKNLSTLFLNDAGKYKFFDAAYSHVSDAANFSSLQSELKDEYYINRFKAMLR